MQIAALHQARANLVTTEDEDEGLPGCEFGTLMDLLTGDPGAIIAGEDGRSMDLNPIFCSLVA